MFADEAESLQYPDLINRGIEAAAQRRGFDLLIRSVGITEHDPGGRTLALARKSDGLILHDRVLEPDQMDRLSRQLPIVTLAGYATPTTANVHGDNKSGMRALARHLLRDHGYPTLAYLGGYADSPDSIERREVLAAEAAAAGAELDCGPGWQGYYFASGGAAVIDRLIDAGRELPRAIVCANDQTALGVMSALREHGIERPRAGGRDRLRRHAAGPSPAHQPDHRPPADPSSSAPPPSTCCIRCSTASAAGERHRAAHRAGPPGELRLPGPGRPRPTSAGTGR